MQKEMDECENFVKNMVPKPPAIPVTRPPLMDCKVDNNKKSPISAKSAMKSKSLVVESSSKKEVAVSPSSLKPPPVGVVSASVGVVST